MSKPGYNGNPHLIRANTPREFTADEIKEYIRCKEDPVYFAETYIRIVHVDKGLVPFEMWDFQKKLINTIHDNRFVICKFPRQTGKSTTVVAYLLHYILFNEQVNIAILANKADTARITLGRLQLAYEYLPDFLKQGIVSWNKGSIELENGSKILATSTSASSVRGSTFNCIFLDEFAHVPNNIAEAFLHSTYPTISSGKETKVIIVSTPLGLNMFYNIWQKAVNKKNEYIPINVHWSEVPGRDEEWKRKTIANTSEELFKVEFETEFVGSTATLINSMKLQSLISGIKEPIYSEENLVVHEHPIQGNRYCIVVDTAQGLGKDASAFSVFDITQLPYKQVAQYNNNEIDPLLYPSIIYNVADRYNEAHVLIETNDVGQQVANIFYHDFGYDNLIKIESRPNMGGAMVSPGTKKRIQLGVRTSVGVKRIGCANLKSLIENNKLELMDETTIMELTTFSAHNQTYKAEEGNKDDLAMTLVLFAWLVTQRVFKEEIQIDVRRNLQEERMGILDSDILPAPIIDDGLGEDRFIDDDGTIWTTVDNYGSDTSFFIPNNDWKYRL